MNKKVIVIIISLLIIVPLILLSYRFYHHARPNIIIILIDALRKDHLGCYGYFRDTSPNIDAFAGDAVKFEDTVSTCSWTSTSVRSTRTRET